MKEILNQLKDYFRNTPRDLVVKEWNVIAEKYADVGPKIGEFLLSLEEYEETEIKTQEIIEEAPNSFGVFLYICKDIYKNKSLWKRHLSLS